MKDTDSGSGGRENRWPSSLDNRDPEGIASFCLLLGYDADDVVNTLVQRCKLDRITARQIVAGVAQKQGVDTANPQAGGHR